MPRWADLAKDAPHFADAVRARFDAHRHKVLATLRRDGAPRISGIEAGFADGDLWLGMMPGSVKAEDLRRDPRLALHSASEDPPDGDPSSWTGDAKLSGRAIELTDPQEVADALRRLGAPEQQGGAHVFRVEVTEAVLTRVGDPPDHLVIEHWHPERGLRRTERR